MAGTIRTAYEIAIRGGTESEAALRQVGKVGAEAFAKIDAAAKQVPASLRAVDAAASQVKSSLQSAAANAGPLGSSLAALGPAGIAAAAGIGALGKVFADSVRFQREFEKGLANLSAITGATGADLAFLKNEAIELGKTTTSSAIATVEAFKLIASAKPELLANRDALAAVTKEAIALAEASGTTVPDAAKLLTTALNQFGVGADQASRFINVLAAGVKFGAAEVPDLAVALVKAGTEAKNAGLTFEQFNAILQKLAAFGTPAEKIGTSLRNIFLKLQEGAAGTNPAIVGVTQALANLAAEQLTVTDLTARFGTENVTVASQLIQVAGGLDEFTNQITATTEAYEQQRINTDTLDASLTRLGGAYDALKAQLVSNQSALRDFVDLLAAGVAGTASAIEGARRYGESLQFVDPLVQAYGTSLDAAAQNLDTVHLQSTELAATTTTLAEQIGFASSAMYSEVAALKALWSEADTATESFKELQKAQTAARAAADKTLVEKELEVAANQEADKLGLDEAGRLRLIAQWKRELAGATAAQAAEESRLQKILDDQAKSRKATTEAERKGAADRKTASNEAEAAAKRAAEQARRSAEETIDFENEARTAGLEGIALIEEQRDIALEEQERRFKEGLSSEEDYARRRVAINATAEGEINQVREKEAEKQAEISRRAADKAAREAERAAEQIERQQLQLAETVGDAFGDALVEFVDNGKIEFEDLWQGFLRTGLRALAQIAAQQLIVNIGANIVATGGGGTATAGGAGGALNTGFGLFQQGQQLLGLGRTLRGGFDTLTGALGGTTTAVTALGPDLAGLAASQGVLAGSLDAAVFGIENAGTIALQGGGGVAAGTGPLIVDAAGNVIGGGTSVAAGSAGSLLLIPGLGLVSAEFFDAAFGQGRFTASGGQLANFALGTIAGGAALGGIIGGGAVIAGGGAAAASAAAGGGIAGLSAGAGAVGGGVAGGAAAGGIVAIVLAAAGVIGLAIAKNLGAFKGPTGGTVARGALSGFLTQPDNGIPYFAGGDFYNARGQAEANVFAEGLNRREPGDPGYAMFNAVLFSDYLREEQRRHPETWWRDLPENNRARVDESGNVKPGFDYLFYEDETRNRRANDTFYQGLERYVAETSRDIGLSEEERNVATGLTAGFRVQLGEDIDLQQPSRQMALLASLLGNIEDMGLDAAQSMEVFAAAVEQLGPGQNVLKSLNDFFTSSDNDLSIDVYRDSIQGLADIYFRDLPRGVDASTIALRLLDAATDEFGQQGTVTFNQLKEQIAAATAEAEALEPALQQAFTAGLFDLELDEVEFADSIFDSVYDALKGRIAEAAYDGLVDGIFTGDILGPFLATFKETIGKVKSGELTQDEGNAILATAAADARDNLETLRPLIQQAVETGRSLAAIFEDVEDAADDAADALDQAEAVARAKSRTAFVNEIDRGLLDALSPQLARQFDQEVAARQRLFNARELGVEPGEPEWLRIERLNELERTAIVSAAAEERTRIEEQAAEQIQRIIDQARDQAERAIESVAAAVKNLTASPASPLPPEQALAAAQTEFDRLAALARGGDLDAIEKLPEAGDNLLALAQTLFGSTETFFTLFGPVLDTLKEIAGLDPGAVKLSADAQAQIAAINADKAEQLAQADQHHAEAMALFQAMLDALTINPEGHDISQGGGSPGDHIVQGVPGSGEPSSGRYGIDARGQDRVQKLLAGLTAGGQTEQGLRQLLSVESFGDLETLAQVDSTLGNLAESILTNFPGINSLSGFEKVTGALIGKIVDPETFSPILGFNREGNFTLRGPDTIPLIPGRVHMAPGENAVVSRGNLEGKLVDLIALTARQTEEIRGLRRDYAATQQELAAIRSTYQQAQARPRAFGAGA